MIPIVDGILGRHGQDYTNPEEWCSQTEDKERLKIARDAVPGPLSDIAISLLVHSIHNEDIDPEQLHEHTEEESVINKVVEELTYPFFMNIGVDIITAAIGKTLRNILQYFSFTKAAAAQEDCDQLIAMVLKDYADSAFDCGMKIANYWGKSTDGYVPTIGDTISLTSVTSSRLPSFTSRKVLDSPSSSTSEEKSEVHLLSGAVQLRVRSGQQRFTGSFQIQMNSGSYVSIDSPRARDIFCIMCGRGAPVNNESIHFASEIVNSRDLSAVIGATSLFPLEIDRSQLESGLSWILNTSKEDADRDDIPAGRWMTQFW